MRWLERYYPYQGKGCAILKNGCAIHGYIRQGTDLVQ